MLHMFILHYLIPILLPQNFKEGNNYILDYQMFLLVFPDMVDFQLHNQISSHLPSFMLLYVSDLSLRQS